MIIGPIRAPLQAALICTLALCITMQLQSPKIGFWDMLGIMISIVVWRLEL